MCVKTEAYLFSLLEMFPKKNRIVKIMENLKYRKSFRSGLPLNRNLILPLIEKKIPKIHFFGNTQPWPTLNKNVGTSRKSISSTPTSEMSCRAPNAACCCALLTTRRLNSKSMTKTTKTTRPTPTKKRRFHRTNKNSVPSKTLPWRDQSQRRGSFFRPTPTSTSSDLTTFTTLTTTTTMMSSLVTESRKF